MWVRKSGGETTVIVIVIVIDSSSLQKGTKLIIYCESYSSISQSVN